MKKIILVILISSFSIGSFAISQEAQMNKDFCSMKSKYAMQIMELRQAEIPIEMALNVSKAKNASKAYMLKELIIEAWLEEITPNKLDKSIIEMKFSNLIHFRCLKRLMKKE